jgi:hypothetical protein
MGDTLRRYVTINGIRSEYTEWMNDSRPSSFPDAGFLGKMTEEEASCCVEIV